MIVLQLWDVPVDVAVLRSQLTGVHFYGEIVDSALDFHIIPLTQMFVPDLKAAFKSSTSYLLGSCHRVCAFSSYKPYNRKRTDHLADICLTAAN